MHTTLINGHNLSEISRNWTGTKFLPIKDFPFCTLYLLNVSQKGSCPKVWWKARFSFLQDSAIVMFGVICWPLDNWSLCIYPSSLAQLSSQWIFKSQVIWSPSNVETFSAAERNPQKFGKEILRKLNKVANILDCLVTLPPFERRHNVKEYNRQYIHILTYNYNRKHKKLFYFNIDMFWICHKYKIYIAYMYLFEFSPKIVFTYMSIISN